MNYGNNGFLDFSKLWVELARQKKNKSWLVNNGINNATISKLTKNENVTCETIAKLCYLLNCQPSRILEYRKPLKSKD